jgi:hypothetical protein
MDLKSQIYPVQEYHRQATRMLMTRFNISQEEAMWFIKNQISKQAKNPLVTYYYKKDNGDMIKQQNYLTDYIKESLNSGDVIVPSFTTYFHPSKQKSIHAEFMAYNTKRRSKYKKIAFKAKQDGDIASYVYNDVMQKTMKIFNNSLSGAYASKSTVLRNPSAHYTLTSITRCVSSIGNAITESLVAGNKHFKTSDIVYNYITTIITNINRTNVEYCINKYKLYIPTPTEVMEMILYSSKWYWHDIDVEKDILNYLEALDDIERASIMYINDLWHMKKYNEKLIRDMITNLITKRKDITDDPDKMKNYPEDLEILTKLICHKEVKGKNINYNELKGTELGLTLISTAQNLGEQYNYYSKLFETFLFTEILPPSIAYIEDMFRDCIVLSDTDSTCGSYDKWIEWYFGYPELSEKNIPISGVIMTLNSRAVDRGLLRLSINMNISEDRLNVLKMKNEFFWSVFTLANMNKHYFANTAVQEGNVFNNQELELKGVHLISSAANQSIVKKVHNMIKDINKTLCNNEKISLVKYITEVRKIEDEVSNMIDSGSIDIFKKVTIKEQAAYKNDVSQSPYFHYLLWNEVFGKKYGNSDEPSYLAIKVPTILDTSKKILSYIESIEDPHIKIAFDTFNKKYNKGTLGTLMLPVTSISGKGIPKEIVPVINKKRILLDNLKSAYIVLESLGFYLKDDMTLTDMGY